MRVYTPTKEILSLSFCRAGLKNRAAWFAALLRPDLPVQDRKNRPISNDASGTEWVKQPKISTKNIKIELKIQIFV